MKSQKRALVSGAMAFITLMGIVSLFSDMTHEGARSVLGEYLNLAGASAATIGFVSGVGELCGYSLRLLSGFLADKTKKYWTLVIVGYALQVLAIPALALIPENGWVLACGLVILERVGKAIKKPAKNTLVSFAASEVGTGKGFAYQEFLDQLGAFLGPVILFVISLIKGTGNLFSTLLWWCSPKSNIRTRRCSRKPKRNARNFTFRSPSRSTWRLSAAMPSALRTLP